MLYLSRDCLGKAVRLSLFFLLSGIFISPLLLAGINQNSNRGCRDHEARSAANDKALGFFKNAETFLPAKILKVHHPSGVREVASYVVYKNLSYVIFSQVNGDCQAKFIKRTRPRAKGSKRFSSRL